MAENDYTAYLIKMCNHLFYSSAGYLLPVTGDWQQVTGNYVHKFIRHGV